MDKCPGLIGGLNNPSDSCNIQSPINEQVLGTLDKLPGNNPVGAWGVSVSKAAIAAAPVGQNESPAPVVSAAGGDDKPAPTVASTLIAESYSPVATPETVVPSSDGQSAPGGYQTLVTSYTSESTTIWTTVTATGPAPTGYSGSGSSMADGWSSYGCYSDSLSSGARVMTGIEFANVGQHAVTNTKCVAYCSDRGFSMAGTEYGGQCFCADSLASGSSKLDDSKCDMPCEGNASQTCGGSLALSVYSKAASKARRAHDQHLYKHIRGASK